MREDRVGRAWELVASDARGNTGKAWALTVLHRNGERWAGLDFGCFSDEASLNYSGLLSATPCSNPVYLKGLRLSSVGSAACRLRSLDGWCAPEYGRTYAVQVVQSDFDSANMEASRLKGITIAKSDFFNANLMMSDMRMAVISESNFSHAILGGANLWGAQLQKTSLRSAIVTNVDFEFARFREVDITGTVWCLDLGCATNVSRPMIESSWAEKNSWNPHDLPGYLKVGPLESWPTPKLCVNWERALVQQEQGVWDEDYAAAIIVEGFGSSQGCPPDQSIRGGDRLKRVLRARDIYLEMTGKQAPDGDGQAVSPR